jgi:pyridoxal phosphate enzyme (YggS family)
MSSATLGARVALVRERIRRASERAGRSDEVTLVAVTKSYPVEVVRQVLEAGVEEIGENRVQELEEKVSAVGRSSARWHLIGHLQRNKVRRALPNFDLLHSLDSVRLARELSAAAEKEGRSVEALVQVNTSGEESKYGLSPAEAADVVGEICELPRLVLIGVMTMAPLTDDPAVIRSTFREARRLSEELARQVPSFEPRHLSMGMSNDYEIAVEEGSTIVRVGTALLGERDP